jgi:hypothetical protein
VKLDPSVDKADGLASMKLVKSISVIFSTVLPNSLIGPLTVLSVAQFVSLMAV